MDGYVDTLLRSDNSPQGQQNPDARAEMVRLFTTSFRNGDLKPADRTYVAKVVSARTGLNEADAEKRVTDVTTQVKADLESARKAAMQIAMWLTLSLFIARRWPLRKAADFVTGPGARTLTTRCLRQDRN